MDRRRVQSGNRLEQGQKWRDNYSKRSYVKELGSSYKDFKSLIDCTRYGVSTSVSGGPISAGSSVLLLRPLGLTSYDSRRIRIRIARTINARLSFNKLRSSHAYFDWFLSPRRKLTFIISCIYTKPIVPLIYQTPYSSKHPIRRPLLRFVP